MYLEACPCTSALSARSWMPWNRLATCTVKVQDPPGAPLDPSLTQADRFLLVFRVCFCLAPFEIGYDVGGKAAASKPQTKSALQQPVVSWKMDGQRVGTEGHASPC